MILLLEDNSERLERFGATLRQVAPAMRLVTWRSARVMVREVEGFLPSAALISLDHDLDPPADDADDPGDGLEVAKFLALRPPVCPVIVHTSNTERGLWMMGEFELAGWRHRRVAPIGDDWIERDWARVARRLLVKRDRSR
jgi:hypothetical protein